MTDKECINIIDELISKTDIATFGECNYDDFMTTWKCILSKYEKSPITEKGLQILTFMSENCDAYNNIFSAKTIGDGILLSPRCVSGAMKKLKDNGYAEKIGGNPVSYAITNKGKEALIEK